MSGKVMSKIWTSALKLNVEYFNFPEVLYKRYGGKEKFDERFLGAHFDSDSEGNQVKVIDPKRYIKTVSQLAKMSMRKTTTKEPVNVFGILHDKDFKKDGDTLVPVGDNFHLLLKFPVNSRLGKVAAVTGITENLLEKSHTKGRYAFSSAMAYLTHSMSTEEEKHRYDPHEVIDGFYNDVHYVDFAQEHEKQWLQTKATKDKNSRQLDLNRVLEDTLMGKLTKDDFLDKKNHRDLYLLYGLNRQRIDDARQTYLDSAFKDYIKAIENGDIDLQVLYISGKAGKGKSWLATNIANGVIKVSGEKSNVRPWRKFDTASKDPMEGLDGEEIILMDDVRANTLNASDWLKLLDPKHGHTIHARYHNAAPTPRLIIITDTHTPHEFFSYAPSVGRDEPLDQFLRRIKYCCQVVDLDNVKIGRQYDVKKENKAKLIKSNSYFEDGQKAFHYVYNNIGKGSSEDVATALIKYYCKHFKLGSVNAKIDVVKAKDGKNALPVSTDRGSQPIKGYLDPAQSIDMNTKTHIDENGREYFLTKDGKRDYDVDLF